MKGKLKRKNYLLDESTLKRAQKILGTKTESETIRVALDMVAFKEELWSRFKNSAGKGKGHVRDIFAT